MSTRACQGSATSGGGSDNYRTGRSSVRPSALNFDNVLARGASSSLTAAQVAQRQRGMMLSQIQSFDAAFSGRAQDIRAGSSGAGTSDPVWLNEVGAQFAAHSNGLSGEQRKANYGKK